MGFADAYLQKAGLRTSLIQTDPHPELRITVTIPAYNESGLERSLDSLFLCGMTPDNQPAIRAPFHTEVLIFINAPGDAREDVLRQNRRTLEATLAWIEGHPHPFIRFHVWEDHSFKTKEAGVGLARKILMDEAVRRFSVAGNPGGIIASLDADAVVDPNYLEALIAHFETRDPDGCSIYFEHPLGPGPLVPGEDFSPGVYDAITRYELHLRYYLNAIRSTGYPYAYHTVGSSFAVRAGIYCLEGGMNRRKAGEDFYFIQKIAQRGNFSECNATRVIPSPRPSNRVPFGTGHAVLEFVTDQKPLSTYHPEPFRMLGTFFSQLDKPEGETDPGTIIHAQPEILAAFLHTLQFGEALEEIRKNSASADAFRKRFWRWFNMFRIMKFLHYARERGYPDVAVGEAAVALFRFLALKNMPEPGPVMNLTRLLLLFRELDRNQTVYAGPVKTGH
jgi:hypothetical protein